MSSICTRLHLTWLSINKYKFQWKYKLILTEKEFLKTIQSSSKSCPSLPINWNTTQVLLPLFYLGFTYSSIIDHLSLCHYLPMQRTLLIVFQHPCSIPLPNSIQNVIQTYTPSPYNSWFCIKLIQSWLPQDWLTETSKHVLFPWSLSLVQCWASDLNSPTRMNLRNLPGIFKWKFFFPHELTGKHTYFITTGSCPTSWGF